MAASGLNLRPKEAAVRIGVSLHTLAHWRVTGEGPRYFKFGRLVFYNEAEIELWERKHLRVAVSVGA